MPFVAIAQSGEIVEGMRDELLAARILSLQRGGEQLYEILRLGRRLRPVLRRRGQEKLLELFLAALQGGPLGLKLVEALTADFCRFLSGHSAVLVELDRVVRHRFMPFFRSLLVADSAPITRGVAAGTTGRALRLSAQDGRFGGIVTGTRAPRRQKRKETLGPNGNGAQSSQSAHRSLLFVAARHPAEFAAGRLDQGVRMHLGCDGNG